MYRCLRKKEHWGDPCKPVAICAEPEFIQIYSQNNNGISDNIGLKYDDTFKHIYNWSIFT